MSAPAAPTGFARAFTGFIDHPARIPSFAAYVTWNRSSGPPSPIEHYIIAHNEPDNVLSDGLGGWIHEFDFHVTGDAVLAALLDSDDLLYPQVVADATNHDGNESLKLSAANADGESSQVTLATWLSGYDTRPADGSELAIPTAVSVTGIGRTTATVNWTPDTTDTLATHWVVKLYRGAVLEREFMTPFYRTSLAIAGLVAGTDYTVDVFARYRRTYLPDDMDGDPLASGPTEFTTLDPDDPEITGPVSIDATVGGLFVGTFQLNIGAPLYWNIHNGPPAVSLTARVDHLDMADLSGLATAAGIYDATILAVYRGEGESDVGYTLPVRFRVAGGAFLTWLHDDPLRADLQIDVRTGAVTSHVFDLANGVRFVRGDTRKVHVIFRDGARVLDTVPTMLRAIIRPTDQFDAEPLLRLAWNGTDDDELNGADRAFLNFAPGGDDLDSIFATLNAAEDAQAGSAQIEGRLELTYTLSGVTKTATPVKAIIAQDYEQ